MGVVFGFRLAFFAEMVLMLFGLGLCGVELAVAYWLEAVFLLEFEVLLREAVTLLLWLGSVALYFINIRQRLRTLVINPQALLNILKLVKNTLTCSLFRLVLLKHKTQSFHHHLHL